MNKCTEEHSVQIIQDKQPDCTTYLIDGCIVKLKFLPENQKQNASHCMERIQDILYAAE